MAANGHEIKDQELTLKDDRQNSPDEDQALERFEASEEPGAQTASGTENRRSFGIRPRLLRGDAYGQAVLVSITEQSILTLLLSCGKRLKLIIS